MKELIIIGAGASGKAAARLASEMEYAVTVIDQFPVNNCEDLRVIDQIEIQQAIELIAEKDVVISPGVDPRGFFAPALAGAKSVISEIEFASRYCSVPYWAITGTNGKTTTVELTTHILKSAGKNVVAAGNIGYPFSAAVLLENLDGIVLELSSFQLEKIERFSPDLVAITNLSSDHENRYDSQIDYFETKLKLLEVVDSKEQRLINSAIVTKIPANRFTTASKDIEPYKSLKLIGPHNIENAQVAVWFAEQLNVPKSVIKTAISDFLPSPHRIEQIKTNIFNDSKSTNPDALIRALETVSTSKNVILIAGGLDKQMDFSKTVEVVENNVKIAILIGESQIMLSHVWKNVTKCVMADNLEKAVTLAKDAFDDQSIILLSPGCASQDMFKNYQDRGEQFRQFINNNI